MGACHSNLAARLCGEAKHRQAPIAQRLASAVEDIWVGPPRLRAHLNPAWVGPHLSSREQTKATDICALASYTASLGASLRLSPDASGSIDRREHCYIRAQCT